MKQRNWYSDHKSTHDVNKNPNLDAALELIGYGKFHCTIMASCAFCFLSSGIQYSLTAYAMPAAHCELYLTSPQIGFINAAFIVGGISSSFLWGVIADLSGRKKVLIVTMLLDVLVTTCFALMQNFIGIIICRFLTGFLIGAPGSVTFTYLAEFHAPKHRIKCIYYSGIFSTIPWLILPALAWCVLRLTINVSFNGFILYSPWRLFVLISVLPEIIGGVWLIYLPETPKFLAINDSSKALAILQNMYEVNTGKNKREFPIQQIAKDVMVRYGNNEEDKTKRLICEICAQIYNLFKPPLLSITLLSAFIMFSNMFGYYGLGLWLPILLNRNSEYHKNLTQLNPTNTSPVCVPNLNTDFYEKTIIMGATAFLSNLLTGWISGNFEKKIIPAVTLLIGAVSAGWMYWVKSSIQYLIASCIFQSAMSVANIAIGSVVVELFPTTFNAIAICTTIMAGRLGAIISNIVFGFLIDANPSFAIFLVCGIVFLGAFLCLFIPSAAQNSIENVNIRNKNDIEISVIGMSS